MSCSELKYDLALYSDDLLGPDEIDRIKAHLARCPNCRQRDYDFRNIQRGLRTFSVATPPSDLIRSVKIAVLAERRSSERSWINISPVLDYRLKMRVFPMGIGVFATLLIGITFLMALFSVPPPTSEQAFSRNNPQYLAENGRRYNDELLPYPFPLDDANGRMSLTSQPPSVNPQGAIIALTRALIRGGMKDDEVVVVADVFGNGLAKITEIVEPSRDKMAIHELEKALKSDPDFAPFVPASQENRPDTVRVVLKLQNVNVPSGSPERKRR